MMTEQEIQAGLQAGLQVLWRSEPLLGSIYDEEEIAAAVTAMREAMDFTRGFGFSASPIPEFEQAFAKYVGAADAVAVNSCGPGLDMVMRYLNLQPGDEVIVPACNYSAAALAVIGAGGQVVLGECDPLYFQLDPADVEKKISPRTRAIFPVHFNGLSAPLAEYQACAERHPHPVHGPAKIVADAARACGGSYRGEKIGCGKHAWATIFSFHTMKNMTTLGEGGMISTDDLALSAYCRSVRMYGSAAGAWGTSNVLTKVQAAVGLVQLSKLDRFIAMRRSVAALRTQLLQGLPGLQLPCEPADCQHSYYLYTCLVDESLAGPGRDAIMQRMEEEFKVRCVIANRPIYMGHPLIARHTAGQRTMQSEALAERIICVPIHPAMSESDNRYICAALHRCLQA